jgi:hypothetical protein
MALTLTEKLVVPGMGSKQMVVYLVTGDGTTRTIQANQIKMQRIEFAYSVNVDNENFTPITDYTSTAPTDTIAFDDEISTGKTQLVIAFGW